MAAEASIQNARHSSPFGSATGRSRLRSSRGQSAAISSSSTSGTGSQRWPTVGLLSEHARSLLRGGRPARLGGSDLTFGDADFAEGRLDAEQGRRGPQVLARADRARARSPKRRPSAPSSGSLAHPMLLEAMSRLRAIWDAWDQSPVSVSNRRCLYRFGTPVTFAYLVFLLSLGQWVGAAISGHTGPASAGIASRRRHVSSRTAT